MDLIHSVRVANIVKSNISSGRKCFKFLKFIDEYNMLIELLSQNSEKEKSKIIQFFGLITKFAGMFYYMFDNIVWISDMGAFRKEIIKNEVNWRNVKDSFSLLKNVCETFKSLIKLKMNLAKEREIKEKLYSCEGEISKDDKVIDLTMKLIL